MTLFQRRLRRASFGLLFALLVTLAGVSQLSTGVWAQTQVKALTTNIFLPLIANTPLGGTVPH